MALTAWAGGQIKRATGDAVFTLFVYIDVCNDCNLPTTIFAARRAIGNLV